MLSAPNTRRNPNPKHFTAKLAKTAKGARTCGLNLGQG